MESTVETSSSRAIYLKRKDKLGKVREVVEGHWVKKELLEGKGDQKERNVNQ